MSSRHELPINDENGKQIGVVPDDTLDGMRMPRRQPAVFSSQKGNDIRKVHVFSYPEGYTGIVVTNQEAGQRPKIIKNVLYSQDDWEKVKVL